MISALEEEVQFSLERVQVDCQLPKAISPVLLSGQPGGDSGLPWLKMNVCRRRMEKRMKRLSLSAQQIVIALDEPAVVAMHAFAILLPADGAHRVV